MEYSGLLCDEELLICTTPPPSSPGAAAAHDHASSYWTTTFQYYYSSHTNVDDSAAAVMIGACREADDADDYLRACVRKQHMFVPRGGYLEKLRRCPELSGFRHKALRWIITARTRLDLSFETAFSAVNYLDRFVSLYTNMKWEAWMMELLSVACLSIAAKFDQVLPPSLHDMPVEDLDHSFDPAAIQRMELAVLRALDWTLNCVTALSFVAPLTSLLDSAHHPRLRRATADRVVELLVGAALDVEFVEYKPSAVALSALRCALEEVAPLLESHGALLTHLEKNVPGAVPQDHMMQEELEDCHRRMGQHPVQADTAVVAYGPTAGHAPGRNQPYDAAPSPVICTVQVTAPPEIVQYEEAVDWIGVGIFLKNITGVHIVVIEGQLMSICEPKKKRGKGMVGGSAMQDQEKAPSS